VESQDLPYTLVITALFVLAIYTGGLWTVLLFRQVAAAFWFTLLVPSALAMIVAYFTEKYDDVAFTVGSLIVVLAAYSIGGFFWARRLFIRAQDVHWTGGTIGMPGWLKLPRWSARNEAKQGLRPRAALLAKEFQLHQPQFIIAGVLALVHLGMIVARKAGSGFPDSRVLEFLTGQFWALWLVMPLLIGCTAVAEERKLGTLEAQLCLPARRRTQFAIKFVVALLLSLFFGVAVPLLFEGTKILPDFHMQLSNELIQFYEGLPHGSVVLAALKFVGAINPCLPLLPLVLIAAGFVAVSFYASTLSRNTLQALAPAILGIVLAWVMLMLMGSQEIEAVVHYPLWRGLLIYFIGVPVLTLTLAWLAYRNYKRVFVGWPTWRQNLLIFLGALAAVMVLTSATYHRVWELLLPIEPPHGASRLSPSQGVMMWNNSENLVVQLPGGRIWTDRFAPTASSLAGMVAGDWKAVEVIPDGRFLEGSNWTSVAVCYREVAAIQKDGSLWVSEQPEQTSKFWWQRSAAKAQPIKMVRSGTDNGWKSVAGHNPPVFLLKTDGTLWRLGAERSNMRRPWPGLRAFEPERLGTDSDWAELSSVEGEIRLRKLDGQAWVGYSYDSGAVKPGLLRFDERTAIERTPINDGFKWRSLAWVYYPGFGSFRVGVDEGGVFRLWGGWQLPPEKKYGKHELRKVDVQLGKETNWLAVAGSGYHIVTLKADGSLWKWDFPDDPMVKPDTAYATRLGTRSDWVAVSRVWGCVTSLAADGSLWLWEYESRRFSPEEFSMPPLLAASRKPQLIGNVFANAE